MRVEVFDAEGRPLGKYEGSGMHTIEEAVRAAADSLDISTESAQVCVYAVTDETDGVTSRYRFNAHGNLHLIV